MTMPWWNAALHAIRRKIVSAPTPDQLKQQEQVRQLNDSLRYRIADLQAAVDEFKRIQDDRR